MKNKPIPLHLKSLPGVFEKLITLPRVKEYEAKKDMLTVTINSFSYKNGIPQDHSGNDGGFVFDCRCLENPGRYIEYKELTGRDQPVIEFLSEKADTKQFIAQSFALIDQAVEAYTKRSFTHLMVSFGCTGGQHRSVYMTERLAAYLKSKYAAHIVVIHHELEKNSHA